jgi:hypothetical protein
MRELFRKKYSYIVVIASLLLTSIIMNSALEVKTSASTLPDSPELAVQTYLEFMSKGDFDNSFFKNASLGMDPESMKGSFQGTTKFDVQKRQVEFVKQLFGTNAWENSTFILESVPSPEANEKWVEKATGKEISEYDGRKLLRQYWDSVGQIEGINPVELFEDSLEGEVTDPKKVKLKKIKDKYLLKEPVEIKVVPFYETYKVILKFNDQSHGTYGEVNFHIYITNKNGKWSLYDGLQWNVIDNGPTGDI